MSNNRPPAFSTDPVLQLHERLVEIDLATNHPPKRLTERQILALDKKWYATLKTLLATPATTAEGRKVKAGLFLRSLQECGNGLDENTMTEAEMIAFSLLSDVVGAAEISRLAAASATVA